MPLPAERQSTTRAKILDAGFALWHDPATSVLANGFTVARIATAAGVTRSTFYSYWPSTEEYVLDLVTHLSASDSMNYPSIVAEQTNGAHPRVATTDIPQAIVESCRAHFDVAVSDESFGLRLAFLSKADDPAIATSLRDLYRQAERSQYAPFLISLDNWGRTLREPFDESMMQIVFSSLLEGLASRYRIDPDAFPSDLYGLALLPLLIILTRRSDDDRNLYEIVDSLNSWPASGLAAKLRERESLRTHEEPVIAATSMREITTSIRRLLARVGFGDLTMEEIAVVTGYSEVTLHQIFGSRSGIALCLLFLNSYERYQAVDPTIQGLERLRILLNINLGELRRNPAIGQNMMLLLSGHTAHPRTDLIDFDPRPMFDEAVVQAIERGELRRDLDAKQFSAVLQRTLFIEGSQLAETTSDIDAIEFLLVGAGATPIHTSETSNNVPDFAL